MKQPGPRTISRTNPSLPTRERGLKQARPPKHLVLQVSLPTRERGLKRYRKGLNPAEHRSLPAREHGLKLCLFSPGESDVVAFQLDPPPPLFLCIPLSRPLGCPIVHGKVDPPDRCRGCAAAEQGEDSRVLVIYAVLDTGKNFPLEWTQAPVEMCRRLPARIRQAQSHEREKTWL